MNARPAGAVSPSMDTTQTRETLARKLARAERMLAETGDTDYAEMVDVYRRALAALDAHEAREAREAARRGATAALRSALAGLDVGDSYEAPATYTRDGWRDGVTLHRWTLDAEVGDVRIFRVHRDGRAAGVWLDCNGGTYVRAARHRDAAALAAYLARPGRRYWHPAQALALLADGRPLAR